MTLNQMGPTPQESEDQMGFNGDVIREAVCQKLGDEFCLNFKNCLIERNDGILRSSRIERKIEWLNVQHAHQYLYFR
jgi:hypothetical protein